MYLPWNPLALNILNFPIQFVVLIVFVKALNTLASNWILWLIIFFIRSDIQISSFFKVTYFVLTLYTLKNRHNLLETCILLIFLSYTTQHLQIDVQIYLPVTCSFLHSQHLGSVHFIQQLILRRQFIQKQNKKKQVDYAAWRDT